MKFLGTLLVALLALTAPALAQNPQTVKLCVPTSGTACPPVSGASPLPVSGVFSATLAGFTPNGNYTTLTATAASSASTALPAGVVVSFQNLSSIDVSCVLSAGAATATTNKLIVRAGATVYYTVGSNVNTACINQTGVASNVVGLAGGAGLGTAFGGASSGGGGGGGAVTMAATAVAAGAYSAGSIAAGAYVAGSILSGALASGAVVDITNLSTPIAAGAATATKGIMLGGQYDSTQKTLTNGLQAALSISSRGAMYVATGAENLVVVGAGTAGSASGGVVTVQGSASGTAIPVSGTVTATPTGTQAVSIASAQVALGAYASGSIAAGALAANSIATGAFATGAISAGSMMDLLTVIGTKNAGTASASSLTAGGVYNSTPLTLTNTQQASHQLDANGYLKVNVAAGGSGAVTVADGADVTQGALADAASSAGGTGSISAKLRLMTTQLDSINSNIQGAIPAGAALIGDVNLRQGGTALSATNGAYFNQLQGNAVLSATNGAFSNILQGNAVLSATNGLYANQLQGNVVLSATNPSFAAPIPTTAGGLLVYPLQPTASANANNIKATPGQVYKIDVFNNSATVNYIRLYNTAGTPTCSSATNMVWQGIIPASTSGAGLSSSWDLGMAFSTGIAVCVTSGYANTDTTNATASALIVNIGYK